MLSTTFTHFALALAAIAGVSASPLLARAEEKIVCRSTVYSGFLHVASPQSSHGAIPYSYPLSANASGTVVTSAKGDHATFMDCAILLEQAPRYDTTYNPPPAFGLVKLTSGSNKGKCLAISKLPNQTVQKAGHQEFVPWDVSPCPATTNDDVFHHAWFRIDAQHEDGTYTVSYQGNNTDNKPSLQGNSKIGTPVTGYYGSIGPAAGQFQLSPNASSSNAD